MTTNAPQKMPDSQVDEPTNEKPSVDISDAIKKIKDSVRNLPTLWLDKTATVSSLLSVLFEVDYKRRRFSDVGFKALFEQLISHDAAEYVYAIDSALSLLAPNTWLQKITAVCRNVALLDSMIEPIIEKVDMTESLSDITDVNSILKDCKDCHIKLNDYECESVGHIELSDLFIGAFVGLHIGNEIKLESPRFKSVNNPTGTIHCKMIYQNASIERDMYGLIVRSPVLSNYVLAVEAREFNVVILIKSRTSTDKSDIGIKRVYTDSTPFYVLTPKSLSSIDDDYGWVRGLPFATIDVKRNFINVYSTGAIIVSPREYFLFHTKTEIFDRKTTELIARMAESGKQNCSRSYALVGIPGTGKSFIMNKLVRDDTESAVVVPHIADNGITTDLYNSMRRVLYSISQEHIFILLDDFDKCIGNSDDTLISQKTIELFDMLHSLCPGGTDSATGTPNHTFTLIATMNNPKLLNNAIIKRSERFDEVIEIGLPQPYIYGKRLNSLRSENDTTDFESVKFRLVYWYMRRKVITLADLGNIYDIMRIHRVKKEGVVRYGIKDLLYAVRFIGKNRSSASKEYSL